MFRFVRRWTGALLVPLIGLVACDDATGPGDATLTVAMTDAPSAYFSSVKVHVGEIQILPADGPPETLTADGGEHDLLALQDGVTADLATLDIEPGTYLQLRLVVDDVEVRLADGLSFGDGTNTDKPFVPSGAQTGIKINLTTADNDGAAGVEIRPGETILVVDFDVEQNFVVSDSDPDDGIVDNVLFTPLLRATVRDVAGSISGTVTSSDTGEGLKDLTVSAELQSSELLEELQTDVVTGVTGDEGEYTLRFLAPGEYSVGVVDFDASSQTVVVDEDEDVTGVNFTGAPTSSS